MREEVFDYRTGRVLRLAFFFFLMWSLIFIRFYKAEKPIEVLTTVGAFSVIGLIVFLRYYFFYPRGNFSLVGVSENGKLRFNFRDVDPYFLAREGVAKAKAIRRYTGRERVLWETSTPVNFRGAFDIDLPQATSELESVEVSWYLFMEFKGGKNKAFASFDLGDLI